MAKSVLSTIFQDAEIKGIDSMKGYSPEIMEFANGIMEIGTEVSRACKHVKVEARKSEKLLQQNFEKIGKIISCHLVLEYLVNKELKLLGIPDKNRNGKPLTCSEKIDKLPKRGMIYSQLIKGMTQMNTIRNKFAHNLDYEIDPVLLTEINKWTERIGIKENEKFGTVEKIENFSRLCIFYFSLRSERGMKHFKILARKYPNLPVFDVLIKTNSGTKG